MPMFITPAEHSKYLFECVNKRPEHVIIASFGIYAGISWEGQDTTQWGENYRLATRDLLELMRPLPDVKLLIGVGEYKSCTREKFGRCLDCEVKYVQSLFRLLAHSELFPEFQWRFSIRVHLKAALFTYKNGVRGVAGGRNFSDSNWDDVTFSLDKPNVMQLLKHLGGLWSQTQKLSTEAIQGVLADQEISETAMRALER